MTFICYHTYRYNVPSLRDEIRQTRPFAHAAEEAFVNVWRTAEVLLYAANEALAPHGLTVTQYNTLRILRGGDAAGLTCAEIGARMVSVAPDVTRLLDRLEAKRLVRRKRCPEDRRQVLCWIEPAGERLLADLQSPMRNAARRRMRCALYTFAAPTRSSLGIDADAADLHLCLLPIDL